MRESIPARQEGIRASQLRDICGSEAGSYLRLIDSCITQLKAQGPSRTYNESKEEEEASEAVGVQRPCGACVVEFHTEIIWKIPSLVSQLYLKNCHPTKNLANIFRKSTILKGELTY